MVTIIATVRSSGVFSELIAFVLSFVVLLPLLVMVGFFLVGYVAKGKTRLRRLLRSCASLALVLFLAGSLLSAVLVSRKPPSSYGMRLAAGEIRHLERAVVDFKMRFGINPPSLIYLCEHSEAWGAEPYSRRFIKRLWPQFNFALERDLNRDGDTSDRIALDGAECLVFFLGGVVDPDSGQPRGFSKNPANPFMIDNGSRDGPFFEFEGFRIDQLFAGRFIDTDGDEFPEYADPFHGGKTPVGADLVPYIYLSSYDGVGYSDADVAAVAHLSASPLKSWYLKGADAPFKPDTYQIISAGADGLFGDGGLIGFREPAWYEVKPDYGPGFDNIANFHSGPLGR